MDSKGITWVGDVFQKFEAMCLEVEEVVCEDTVKYVENQVQTVGASFKKFYSDVMQDLLPPSSIDPVKVAVADLSLNAYADFGIYKKPRASIEVDPIKVDKHVAKDSKVGGLNVDHTTSLGELHDARYFPPSSAYSIKGSRMQLCSEKNVDRGTHECSNVAVKRTFKRNNHLSSMRLRSITPGSKDLIEATLRCEISDNHEPTCDQIVRTSSPSSVKDTGSDSRGGGKISSGTVYSIVSIADTSVDIPASERSNVAVKRTSERNNHMSSTRLRSISPGSKDLIEATLCREISDNHETTCDQIFTTSSPASVQDTGNDSRGEGKFSSGTVCSAVSIADASGDIPASDMILPGDSCLKSETKLRSSSVGPGTCTNSGGIVPVESHASGDRQYSESANVEDGSSLTVTGRSDDQEMDLIDKNGKFEPGIDTNQQFDNLNLEETCVLVDSGKVCLISKEDKPRSYKKKIRKAFSSKKSARKQEYEQLAVQYGDTETGSSNHKGVENLNPTLSVDTDTKKLPTHSSCESEWELL